MDLVTVLFAFLALIGFGGGAICDKIALRGLPASAAVVARSLMTAVIFAGYGVLAGQFRRITAAGAIPLAWLVAGVVVNPVLGQFALYKALKFGEASRVVPIAASYPLVTVILAALFLGEKLTAPKVAGVLCIVAGIGLITGLGRAG